MKKLLTTAALCAAVATGPAVAQSTDTLVPQMSELEVVRSTQDSGGLATFVPEILAVLFILLAISHGGSYGER